MAHLKNKSDVYFLLNVCHQAPLQHVQKPFLQRRVATRHYVNVTESGLSGDRVEFHRSLSDTYIYLHDQWSMSAAAQPVSLLNPLKPELIPICYLLALLPHHFLHVSRVRVKSLTIRLLMSYIYGAPILDVSRSHTTTQHSR